MNLESVMSAAKERDNCVSRRHAAIARMASERDSISKIANG